MKKIYTIGRDPACDIVIDDAYDVVSRSHATLRIEKGKYYLTDHSTNGTYRNGIKLEPNVESLVSREDEISFGSVAFLDWSNVPRGFGRTARLALWVGLPIVVVCLALLFLIIRKPWEKEDVTSIPDGKEIVENVIVNNPSELAPEEKDTASSSSSSVSATANPKDRVQIGFETSKEKGKPLNIDEIGKEKESKESGNKSSSNKTEKSNREKKSGPSLKESKPAQSSQPEDIIPVL